MSLKSKLTILGVGVASVLLFVAFFSVFNWTQVQGNERLVIQNWKTGILDEVIGEGTFFYMPITTTPYRYVVGTDKFIMGRAEFYSGTGHDTVDYPPFTITTGGTGKEQPATFSVTLQYRLDPNKLIALHRMSQNNYEDLVIKPALTRIISDLATQKTVLEFYSGAGRVELQFNIEDAIRKHPLLAEVGIWVETFVIDDIKLDTEYVAEITGRQLATQKTLRAIEETKAAEEVARKVEAEAQADKLKKIVEAEAEKEQRIRAAQASAEEVRLAAIAAGEKVRVTAEADRFMKEQNAKGLLAQGLAEAEVAEKVRDARYKGEAGARYAAVEIENARVELFKNMSIQGVVPEGTLMTIINGNSGRDPLISVPASASR